MTIKVKGEGRDVTWCVWQVLADKSRTKIPWRNTKIGRKVAPAHPSLNMKRISKLVHRWSMRSQQPVNLDSFMWAGIPSATPGGHTACYYITLINALNCIMICVGAKQLVSRRSLVKSAVWLRHLYHSLWEFCYVLVQPNVWLALYTSKIRPIA